MLLLLFSHPVVSDSLRPHGLQDTRLPCPSPSLRACSNPRPMSQWCHPTISFSVTPISSCPQSFPASGSFPMSQLFASSGQSTGASASASVLPRNIQGWFPLGLTGLISLLSKELSKVFPAPQFESISSSALSLLYGSTHTFIHDYWKKHSFVCADLCWQLDVSAFLICCLGLSKLSFQGTIVLKTRYVQKSLACCLKLMPGPHEEESSYTREHAGIYSISLQRKKNAKAFNDVFDSFCSH